MATIKWQDPPGEDAESAPAIAWEEETRELRAKPGKWGVVTSYPVQDRNAANVMSATIKRGGLLAFSPRGTWTARTATEPEDRSKPQGRKVVNVYAKYLGEPEPTEAELRAIEAGE